MLLGLDAATGLQVAKVTVRIWTPPHCKQSAASKRGTTAYVYPAAVVGIRLWPCAVVRREANRVTAARHKAAGQLLNSWQLAGEPQEPFSACEVCMLSGDWDLR